MRRGSQSVFHRKVLDRDGNRCVVCRRSVEQLSGIYPDLKMLIADHIIPVALGGTDDPANGRTLCFFHNGMFGWRARYKKASVDEGEN